MVSLIALIGVFIFLSGIVAMVDAAILSVSRAETEEAAALGLWGAMRLKTVTERITRSVVAIVIVTNSINSSFWSAKHLSSIQNRQSF